MFVFEMQGSIDYLLYLLKLIISPSILELGLDEVLLDIDSVLI